MTTMGRDNQVVAQPNAVDPGRIGTAVGKETQWLGSGNIHNGSELAALSAALPSALA
ncbi:hypothetical protein ACFL5O_02350 [Myxococcota bacterium]